MYPPTSTGEGCPRDDQPPPKPRTPLSSPIFGYLTPHKGVGGTHGSVPHTPGTSLLPARYHGHVSKQSGSHPSHPGHTQDRYRSQGPKRTTGP